MTTSPSPRGEDARAHAKNSFWRAGASGLAKLIDDAPSTWKGPEQRFYRAEKELIVEHASPFYWGAVVSGVLFLTFRVSGSRRFIQFREAYFRKGPTAHKEPANVKAEEVQRRWQSYLDKQTEEKEAVIRSSLSLPTDIIVSIMCGCSSAAILFDTAKFQKDLVRAPLLPGKSLVHTHICHYAVKAYADCEQLDSNVFSEVKDPLLRTFQAFAMNCTTRSDIIERRRAFGDDRPDVIPYPGLLGAVV
jgi:hypothetical protein